MQLPSPLYEDLYLLSEKMVNNSVASKKHINLKTFYNVYIALHDFNNWFADLIRGDLEQLFKAYYFDEKITIEKWEHSHYWSTFLLFMRGSSVTEKLLLNIGDMQYSLDAPDMPDWLIARYINPKSFYGIAKTDYSCGKFDEVSMILKRSLLVFRDGVLCHDQIEYDLNEDCSDLAEASKAVVQKMFTLENRMASYLRKYAHIEDLLIDYRIIVEENVQV